MTFLLEKYDSKLHNTQVQAWLKERNMPEIRDEFLPKTGYIINDIVCAFLYCTDSKIGLVDNLISNPKSEKTDRNEAIDLIIDKLLVEAKNAGLSLVVAFTSLRQVLLRGKRLGWIMTDKNQVLISRKV